MDNPENLAGQGTQDEEKHNIICVGHHYTQTNTNHVNKTSALLQQTGGTPVNTGYLCSSCHKQNRKFEFYNTTHVCCIVVEIS